MNSLFKMLDSMAREYFQNSRLKKCKKSSHNWILWVQISKITGFLNRNGGTGKNIVQLRGSHLQMVGSFQKKFLHVVIGLIFSHIPQFPGIVFTIVGRIEYFLNGHVFHLTIDGFWPEPGN
jgi:hypothetical protein